MGYLQEWLIIIHTWDYQELIHYTVGVGHKNSGPEDYKSVL